MHAVHMTAVPARPASHLGCCNCRDGPDAGWLCLGYSSWTWPGAHRRDAGCATVPWCVHGLPIELQSRLPTYTYVTSSMNMYLARLRPTVPRATGPSKHVTSSMNMYLARLRPTVPRATGPSKHVTSSMNMHLARLRPTVPRATGPSKHATTPKPQRPIRRRERLELWRRSQPRILPPNRC